MYLRSTKRVNKDGSTVRYLSLAHNVKVGGVSQAKVLLGLGREDQLDEDGLRRLVSSLSRYLGDPDPYADPDADPVAGLTVTFQQPDKDRYDTILLELAKQYGVQMPSDQLFIKGQAFALRAGGRSPRVAKQFVELLAAGVKA